MDLWGGEEESRTREESHSLIKVLHNTICAIILHNKLNHNWFQNQWSQELTLFSFRFPQRHTSWEIQYIAALLLPSKNSSNSVTWNSVFLYTYSLTYSHPLKQDLNLEEQGGWNRKDHCLTHTHTHKLHCYWGRYYSNTSRGLLVQPTTLSSSCHVVFINSSMCVLVWGCMCGMCYEWRMSMHVCEKSNSSCVHIQGYYINTNVCLSFEVLNIRVYVYKQTHIHTYYTYMCNRVRNVG